MVQCRSQRSDHSSIWSEWFKEGEVTIGEHYHASVSWAEKKTRPRALATVTTGRVGSRIVGSASFGLLVWGSAFIAPHQRPALFSSLLFLCECVHSQSYSLGFTLPFHILHLCEVSPPLCLSHTSECMVKHMHRARTCGGEVTVDIFNRTCMFMYVFM